MARERRDHRGAYQHERPGHQHRVLATDGLRHGAEQTRTASCSSGLEEHERGQQSREEENQLNPRCASEDDRAEHQQVVPSGRNDECAKDQPDRDEKERVGEVLAHPEGRVVHERRNRAQDDDRQRRPAREHETRNAVDREQREGHQQCIHDLEPRVGVGGRKPEGVKRREHQRVQGRVREPVLTVEGEVPTSEVGGYLLVAKLIREDPRPVDLLHESDPDDERRDADRTDQIARRHEWCV